MKKYKVIILGGGAGGCMCAMATKEKSVAIIDANSKLAKKILVTGNGRCNLTNKNMSSAFFNVNIDKYLLKFDVNKTLRFFNDQGLEYYSDEEGRVYPLSNSAKSVQDIIVRALKNKVDFFGEEKIESVEYNKNFYLVKTNKDEYQAEKLVIATGGNSLDFLKNLDIKTNKSVPSLVALKTKETKELSGIKLSNVKVMAKSKNGIVKSDIGEVLFKDKGLSGIVIFNLSTIFAREGEFSGIVKVDLLPNISLENLCKLIEKRKKLNVNLDKIFVGMFQNAVANEIFKQCKLDTNKMSSVLNKTEIEKISQTIKSLSFKVVDCYDNNQVFCGGINLDQLNEELEHKKYKNLYVIGEACNVDGECGGYNLQWAWTSGAIVGEKL